LKKKLDELDFGFIDSHFDEGEVDSIDYEVKSVTKVKKGSPNMITFDDSDEDFQEMLDEDEDDYENEEVWEDIEEED
jgi:hypothetical protein